MKKITSIILLLSAFGCGPSREELEQQGRIEKVSGTLVRLGSYEIGSGTLYKLGEDTLYWAEGSSTHTPIALHIK